MWKRGAGCGYYRHEWVMETEANIEELAELVYAKQRLGRVSWVLAVPEIRH